jgi:hypothetical protein
VRRHAVEVVADPTLWVGGWLVLPFCLVGRRLVLSSGSAGPQPRLLRAKFCCSQILLVTCPRQVLGPQPRLVRAEQVLLFANRVGYMTRQVLGPQPRLLNRASFALAQSFVVRKSCWLRGAAGFGAPTPPPQPRLVRARASFVVRKSCWLHAAAGFGAPTPPPRATQVSLFAKLYGRKPFGGSAKRAGKGSASSRRCTSRPERSGREPASSKSATPMTPTLRSSPLRAA